MGAVASDAGMSKGASVVEAARAAEAAATEVAPGETAETDTQGVQEGMEDPGTAAAAISKNDFLAAPPNVDGNGGNPGGGDDGGGGGGPGADTGGGGGEGGEGSAGGIVGVGPEHSGQSRREGGEVGSSGGGG